MIKGIEHLGIAARDPAALKDWYIKVFGLALAYDNGKTPPTFFLRFPDRSMIEIYPMASEAVAPLDNFARGLRHIAVEVSGFEAERARISGLGVEEVAAKAATGGTSTFFFRDPEGNIVHLIQRAAPL